MKGAFQEAKSGHVLILVLAIFFLADAAWSQQSWQLHASPQDRSPSTAQVLSLVGTALPFGLMAAAFGQRDGWDGIGYFLASLGASVIGPAPGYFYGGLWGRGFAGMGLRAIGVLGVFVGIAAADNGSASGTVVSLGGAGIIIGSMIYDLVAVSDAVRRRNMKRSEKTLAISPVYIPQQKAFGIHVRIGFS